MCMTCYIVIFALSRWPATEPAKTEVCLYQQQTALPFTVDVVEIAKEMGPGRCD